MRFILVALSVVVLSVDSSFWRKKGAYLDSREGEVACWSEGGEKGKGKERQEVVSAWRG